MSVETDIYNQRVEYQGYLDELFPRGAFFAVVRIDPQGVEAPTGIGGITGRVFCSDARATELGWEFQLFFEVRWLREEAYEFHPIYRAWTAALDGTDEVETYEVRIVAPDESALIEVMRLRSDPTLQSGQREWVTGLWLDELFPFGLERREEALNAVSDIG